MFPITEEEVNMIQRYQKEIMKQDRDSYTILLRREKEWKPFCYIVNELWHLLMMAEHRIKVLNVKKMRNIEFNYRFYKSENYSVIYEDKLYMVCRTLTHDGEQVRIFEKRKRFSGIRFYELAAYEIRDLKDNKFKIEYLRYKEDHDFLPLFILVKDHYLQLIQNLIDRKTAINAYADLIDNILLTTREKTND
jgi:hypothetical protein